MRKLFTFFILSLLVLPFCHTNIFALQLETSSFEPGKEMPLKHAYYDENISPALKWSGVPPGTRSFAIVCEDPDAPVKVWVHWVIYNIPRRIRELDSGIPSLEILDNGAIQGTNDFGEIGYGGPSPPAGFMHRYIFEIFALDTMLDLRPKATKTELYDAIRGHIIGKAKLIGTYLR